MNAPPGSPLEQRYRELVTQAGFPPLPTHEVELLHDQELEADRYGLDVVLAGPRPDLGVDLSYDFVLDAVTMGAPCFFLALESAVRQVTAAWAPPARRLTARARRSS